MQDEIDRLKAKLEERRLREKENEGEGGVGGKEVEKARSEVVQCLRAKDRRPLDCWREVETFKQRVGEVEGRLIREVWER